MNDYYFYVAPKESMDFIQRNGIFTPKQVRDLIKKGDLDEQVLGVSFGGLDASNFPDHVSLVGSEILVEKVASSICYSRHETYFKSDFMAIGYVIRKDIEKEPRFKDHDTAKSIFRDLYPTEVLFEGIIDPKYIVSKFAARPKYL